MVNKKETLVCECKKIPTKSERAVLGSDCVCKASSRKGREFERVIVEEKNEDF